LTKHTFRLVVGPQCSEDEFQGQLHKAPWQRFRDFAEVWRTDVVVRQPEVSAVENVEELGAELQPLGLANRDVLECGEIPLFEAGSIRMRFSGFLSTSFLIVGVHESANARSGLPLAR
jgi:hypothetical protein